MNQLYFNPKLVQYDNNKGLDGSAEEIQADLDALANCRLSADYDHHLYWREQHEWSESLTWQQTKLYLNIDSRWFNAEIDGKGETFNGIEDGGWFPHFCDAELESTPKYAMFKSDLPAFHRKMYLYHPADKRGLYLERFGAIIENVSTSLAMGRILRLRWSHNFCAALIRAPKLKDLVKIEAYIHKFTRMLLKPTPTGTFHSSGWLFGPVRMTEEDLWGRTWQIFMN